MLPLGGPGLAKGNIDARSTVACPPAPSWGAMNSTGTSTRFASLAAAPTFWICRVANSGAGGESSGSGN